MKFRGKKYEARERDLRLTYLRRGAWGGGGQPQRCQLTANMERDLRLFHLRSGAGEEGLSNRTQTSSTQRDR